MLLISDQAANRLPPVCMRTGRRTNEVVSMRVGSLHHFERWTFVVGTPLALLIGGIMRRPSSRIVLPVTAGAWVAWRRSFMRCVLLGTAGAAFLLTGLVRQLPAVIAIGVVLIAINWLLRIRLRLQRWIGVELVPEKGHIIVSRVHPEFDREAAALFRAAFNARR